MGIIGDNRIEGAPVDHSVDEVHLINLNAVFNGSKIRQGLGSNHHFCKILGAPMLEIKKMRR
jgi:hypothetical protein